MTLLDNIMRYMRKCVMHESMSHVSYVSGEYLSRSPFGMWRCWVKNTKVEGRGDDILISINICHP